MTSNEVILNAKLIYEHSFNQRTKRLQAFIDPVSERDVLLSGHVFVAKKDARIYQITLDDEAVPCFFSKRAGIDFDFELLQVMINSDNLRVEECFELLDRWFFKNSSAEALKDLAWETPE